MIHIPCDQTPSGYSIEYISYMAASIFMKSKCDREQVVSLPYKHMQHAWNAGIAFIITWFQSSKGVRTKWWMIILLNRNHNWNHKWTDINCIRQINRCEVDYWFTVGQLSQQATQFVILIPCQWEIKDIGTCNFCINSNVFH